MTRRNDVTPLKLAGFSTEKSLADFWKLRILIQFPKDFMSRSSPSADSPPAPRKRLDERTVHSRIVAGARCHFLAQGFRNVTMDDLAAELGMSKKTLYTHFPSKLVLVESVLQAKVAEAEAAMARIMDENAADFQTALRELLLCVDKQTSEIHPAFVRDLRREAPELFKIVEEGRRRMIQNTFGSLLSKGRKLGMIRKDLPMALITEVLLVATQSIVNPVKLEEMGMTPKTAYTAIIQLVLEGAINTKGKS